jgi:TorA maturation chaperone TorD
MKAVKEVKEKDNRADMARARANVYHLLSRVFIKEVSPEFLKTLKDKQVLATLNELGADLSPILDMEEKELLDAMAEEYAALFVLAGGFSPYESVRLKGLLCQEPECAVKGFYAKCGLTVNEDSKIFADHLGMELEFMGYLADRETEAFENDEKEALTWRGHQRRFFDEHINKWVYSYLDDVGDYARHPFYEMMSKLTRGFLEVENGELESPEVPT